MSNFIKWTKDDEGYDSSGQHLYTLNREAGHGEPVYYTPMLLVGGYLEKIPNRYFSLGWMTKAAAKKTCERHYTKTPFSSED